MARTTRSPRRSASRRPSKTSHAEAGPRIVVVDDEPDILNVVVLLLAGDGFHVSATSSREEAIAMMDGGPVHLVITDLRLAGGDGTDIIKHAAELRPRRPAIILLTGARVPTESAVAHLIVTLNITVVQKPFDIDYLLDLARSLTGWPGSA
ncbi:MAG TPA: response regulator [Ktedonobacterales bacterium]